MKLFIATICLFIVFIGVFIFFKKKDSSNSDLVNNIVSENKADAKVSVSSLNSNVSVLSSSKKTVVSSKENVSVGDTIETDISGRGLIETGSGSVSVLDYSSKIRVSKEFISDKRESLFLDSGRSWSKVKKVFGNEESYEIETQNAVAIVRGTSFGVYIKNATTYLVVTEGSVLFVPIDPLTRERIFQRSVLVKALNKAYIDKNGNVIVSPITDADIKDDWYVYNNSISTADLINKTLNSNSISTSTLNTGKINTNTQPSSLGTGGGASTNPNLISIKSFSPLSASSGQDVHIYGSGFSKLKSVSIGDYLIDKNSIVVRGDSDIIVTIPDLMPDKYFIYLVDLNNNQIKSQDILDIVDINPDLYQYQYGQ